MYLFCLFYLFIFLEGERDCLGVWRFLSILFWGHFETGLFWGAGISNVNCFSVLVMFL